MELVSPLSRDSWVSVRNTDSMAIDPPNHHDTVVPRHMSSLSPNAKIPIVKLHKNKLKKGISHWEQSKSALLLRGHNYIDRSRCEGFLNVPTQSSAEPLRANATTEAKA